MVQVDDDAFGLKTEAAGVVPAANDGRLPVRREGIDLIDDRIRGQLGLAFSRQLEQKDVRVAPLISRKGDALSISSKSGPRLECRMIRQPLGRGSSRPPEVNVPMP